MSFTDDMINAKAVAEKRILREYVLQLAGRSKSAPEAQKIVNALIHKVLTGEQIAMVNEWVRAGVGPDRAV